MREWGDMMARSRCMNCGCVFVTTHAFDAHRAGGYDPPGRHCLGADEMLAKGMLSEHDIWHVPMSEQEQERMKKLRRS